MRRLRHALVGRCDADAVVEKWRTVNSIPNFRGLRLTPASAHYFFMWGLLFHSVIMQRPRFTRASAHEFDSVEVVAMEQSTAAFVAAWRWFKLRVSVS